ncbi:MAG: 2-amino-4-ketopentanoate thiolase [Deltaproteobacteria bacterium]|uniref:2-amino-4-ketopentanoate thiolase n=1 Tax=Candidatus Zymogenus saltonus TaxID=2844893 RepID=A0A9D8KG37_9DELT|nr:2-amino-4-ketopentanoate thiolase [Candidatus Zymogenus saltonus]
MVKEGSWVEVHRIVLEPGERAPQVPEDTKKVPLEMRVKGYLNDDAGMGDEVEITTAVGRVVSGKLTAVNPPYDHGFGEPIPELISIGREVKKIIGKEGDMRRRGR